MLPIYIHITYFNAFCMIIQTIALQIKVTKKAYPFPNMAELSDLNWRFTKQPNPDFSRKREHVKQALVQVENIKIELESVQVRILSFAQSMPTLVEVRIDLRSK